MERPGVRNSRLTSRPDVTQKWFGSSHSLFFRKIYENIGKIGLGRFGNIFFVKIILRKKTEIGRNRGNSGVILKWGVRNGSFEVNDARISMILSQIRKHNPQIFPCGAYYRESSPYRGIWYKKTGNFEGFFFVKLFIFFVKFYEKFILFLQKK